MDEFAWSHRPLLVFATSVEEPALLEQRELLAAHREGLNERDMVVIELVGDDLTVDGQPRTADTHALRKRYGVPTSRAFAVLLVGKDTGVKLRSDRPVTAEGVFGLIDSMPMRRQEMREASE
ncbi:DUF4174 domain-containing protein [Algisphaera agarilytica]|uniref:DUF4174 domain-containing protein n=1 Tax=Algisphaera agarilytica TaxID=1385975 RepID=A0A7X0H4N1_9BACT|nr:DUF4174 domain-containing protein [Algisphaera agarilytica]MBB6428947.1 hypothetical protein [Algisphaera agarilytica]